ncbi:hypothetical protein BD311DRAFT_743477 [Dichomitus squalens]|uniref:Uncharacterized protein n=1 Tax=Dichomitus squalens TaxID=114155 RepID=A0A4V2JYM0_9APHY|nr:hypothetical protein BD311DRAFT_743477 [Dichomitus squalens]
MHVYENDTIGDALDVLASAAAGARPLLSPGSCLEGVATLSASTTNVAAPQLDRTEPQTPRVVFGSPPPRVLTTPPEKPPAKSRKSRKSTAAARDNARQKKHVSNDMETNSAALTNTAPEKDTSHCSVVPTAVGDKLKAATSPALGRGKRQRVVTARALDESPDMSAVNKLKRRAQTALGISLADSNQTERVAPEVKRRKRGSN